MRRTTRLHGIGIFAATAVVVLGSIVPTAWAGSGRLAVNGTADIDVWVENSGVVHSSYEDVVISVRAARGCFATLMVIDTHGYMHVVYPLSPQENVWLDRGVTYRFTGRDLGLGGLGGRGIAHVCAIGSPHPFDYSPWGDAIFTGGFGYRVYGDPYMACGEFYTALLPDAYARAFAGIGFARFYVREWRRYPVYLCHGYHSGAVHVRTGDHCRRCSHVYDLYRIHVNEPVIAVRPERKYKETRSQESGIRRTDITSFARVAERQSKTAYKRNAKIVSARRTAARSQAGVRTTTVTRATGAKNQPDAEQTRLVNGDSKQKNTPGRRGASGVHYKAKAKKGKVANR
jgi:hypothetical protein